MEKTQKVLAWTSIRWRWRGRNALLHFLEKPEYSSKTHPFQLPFSFLFRPFFKAFPESPKRDPGSGHRATKIHENGPQRCPNGVHKSTNWAPRSHQVRKTCKNKSPRVAKWSPKRYNGVAGPPKVQEKQKKASQSANKTWKCATKWLKTHKHT